MKRCERKEFPLCSHLPSPLTYDHGTDGQQDEGVPAQEAQHVLPGHGLQAQARAQRSLLHALLQLLQPAHPAQPLATLPQKEAVAVAAHFLSAGDRGPKDQGLVRDRTEDGCERSGKSG